MTDAVSAGTSPSSLKALDQAGIDQQTIEAPSLRPAGARIKYATAALEDLLLLGEGGVERHPRSLERDQREVGCIERIESRGYIGRHEIDGVDRVIGGQVARIACLDASCNLSLVERRIDGVHREFRLMVAVAHQKKGFAREFPFEAAEKRGIVARTHRLPPQVLVDLRLVSEVAPLRRQLRAIAVTPRKMIGRQKHEDEKRVFAPLPFDDLQGLIVEEPIWLQSGRAHAHVLGVDKILDAG